MAHKSWVFFEASVATNKMKKVRKAVIPAAGFGTRFLPATKAQPKEMLPIVDKPIIQYVVEQAVAAGITQIVIVTGWHKRAIEDHFDRHFELESRLSADGKEKELAEIRQISNLADFIYVRQKEPLGNGHAVLVAEEVIGDEPFAVMWGDEFIAADPPALAQLLSAFEKYQVPVISGVRIENKKDLSKYGIADIKPVDDGIFEIKNIIEKPEPGNAPSNLAAHCNYILTPEIFKILKNIKPGKNGEIWLPEAIDVLVKKEKVLAVEIKNGKYFDCGSKIGYLKTVVEFGLKHSGINGEFRNFLKSLKL